MSPPIKLLCSSQHRSRKCQAPPVSWCLGEPGEPFGRAGDWLRINLPGTQGKDHASYSRFLSSGCRTNSCWLTEFSFPTEMTWLIPDQRRTRPQAWDCMRMFLFPYQGMQYNHLYWEIRLFNHELVNKFLVFFFENYRHRERSKRACNRSMTPLLVAHCTHPAGFERNFLFAHQTSGSNYREGTRIGDILDKRKYIVVLCFQSLHCTEPTNQNKAMPLD